MFYSTYLDCISLYLYSHSSGSEYIDQASVQNPEVRKKRFKKNLNKVSDLNIRGGFRNDFLVRHI